MARTLKFYWLHGRPTGGEMRYSKAVGGTETGGQVMFVVMSVWKTFLGA